MAADRTRTLRRSRQSEAAWREWFSLVYPRVFFAVYGITDGDLERSKDITQSAIERFLRYRALDRVETDDDAVGYLIRTARRVNVDLNRQTAARLAAYQASSAEQVTVETPYAGGEGIEALDLERLAHRLSKNDQQLVAWLLAGRTISEVAADLGIGYTAAATRIHRAKSRLRNLAADV